MRVQIVPTETGKPDRLLEALCSDLAIQCSNEATSRLSGFIKTDLIGEPFPLLLRLRSTDLTLVDPPNPNPMERPQPPFRMKIPAINLVRKEDGIFVLQPSTSAATGVFK